MTEGLVVWFSTFMEKKKAVGERTKVNKRQDAGLLA
jgi:hypothetical protein